MTKRKRNKIGLLQKLNRDWCKNEQEIEKELCNHYRELFTPTKPGEFDEILQRIPCTISSLMNEQLIKQVEETEIQQALFSMFPNKAPGVDGMSPLFFQNYWPIIKVDVIKAISSFFHSRNLLKYVNETIISLIPKIDNPVKLINFRPISLCIVLYKVI